MKRPLWTWRSAGLGLAVYAPLTASAYALVLATSGWVERLAAGVALLFISSPGMFPASLFYTFKMSAREFLLVSWAFSAVFWVGLAGFLNLRRPSRRASD